MSTNRRGKQPAATGTGDGADSRTTTTVELSRSALTDLHTLRAALGYPTLAATFDGEAGEFIEQRAREVREAMSAGRPVARRKSA